MYNLESSNPITYREPTAGDEPFLLEIYADSRRDELAMFGWDAHAIDAFVRMQYSTRERAYRMQHPKMDDRVICLNAEIAGRLMVDRSGPAIHVVDIAVAERFRRRGIGTAVIRHLKDEAGDFARRLTLRVEQANSVANQFYRSLGLHPVRTDGHLTELSWSADEHER